MTKKKWIVFDLDDVVFNFRQQWYEASLNEGLVIPHWSEWPSYDYLDYFKLKDINELNAMLIKHQCLEKAKPEPEALEALQALKERGYMLGALSARSWHPRASEATLEAFKRHHLPFDKLVISGLYFDKKSEHIEKFGEICGYIDDSSKHIEDFKSKGIPNVILRQRPWNIEMQKTLPSVNSLTEFVELINK